MVRRSLTEHTMSPPRSAALARARSVLVPSGPAERALLAVAAVFAVAGVVHLIPLLATDGSWWGAVSWRKPLVFGVSTGVVTWWLAWVLDKLFWSQRGKAIWVTAYTAVMALEYTVLTAQQWRGVPSHFNNRTSLDAALFGVMGAAIAMVSVLIVMLAVAAVRRPPREAALRWTVLGGLALIVVGLSVGGLLVQLGNAQTVDDSAPEVVRAGAAGVPKYLHAVALHTPQALVGLLALVGAAGLSPAVRRTVMRRGVATCAAFVVATGAHTLAGRALFDVMNPTGLFLLATLAGCTWPFASAMMAAWHNDRTQSVSQRDASRKETVPR